MVSLGSSFSTPSTFTYYNTYLSLNIVCSANLLVVILVGSSEVALALIDIATAVVADVRRSTSLLLPLLGSLIVPLVRVLVVFVVGGV